MKEFFDLALSIVNLPLTILLALLLVYWIVVMVGGLDAEMDLGVEADADIDFDMDVDTGLEGGNVDFNETSNAEVPRDHVVNKRRRQLKPWQVFLIYFNFVGLPFMFTFTVFIFLWWLIVMLSTAILGAGTNLIGFLLFFAAIIPALIFTKVFTTPFKAFFKNLNQNGDAPAELLGRQGTSLSNITGEKLGRAEVMIDGNPLNIYIKSLNGEPIGYHQAILIIKESNDKNFYFVKPYNN